jgi:hypothetical protein
MTSYSGGPVNKLVLIFLASIFFFGCSNNKDMEKVGNAQQCLDKSSSDTASGCLTEIEGLTSKEAYLVKCAGGFIAEGFNDPTRLVSALQNAKSNNGGGSSATTVFSVLAFYKQTDPTLNVALAEKTYNNCTASENTGFSLIAALSNMATKITAGSHTPDTMFSTDNLATTIQNISNPETLGAIATAAFQASCSSGTTSSGSSSTGSSQDLCSSLSTYTSDAANNKQVGCCLKQKMLSPTALCDSTNADYTTCLN